MRKWLLHIIPTPAPLMIAQLTNYRGRDNVVTISILSTIYSISILSIGCWHTGNPRPSPVCTGCPVLSPRSEAGLKGHFRQRGVLQQPIFAPIFSKPPYRHCRILKSDLTINDLLKNKIKKENPDEPSSSFVLWNQTIQHLTTCTANIYLCPVASTSLPR